MSMTDSQEAHVVTQTPSFTLLYRARDRAGHAHAIGLRVPKWIGAGGLAIVGGAAAGMLIAMLFQPTVAAAPTAGAVTITSDPPGLTLSVDGTPRGVTPLATMLAAGWHRVEVGSGERVRLHQLQVRAGSDASLHVEWAFQAGAADR
jgi:hypothetical protein